MTDAYHQQVVHQLDQARAELARLHEGEEEYTHDRLVPTPGQWIWRWNRATPGTRYALAAQVLDLWERVHHCVIGLHEQHLVELRQCLADEHRTSADRATELHRMRQLLRAAEDELAVHRQRAATRPVETRALGVPWTIKTDGLGRAVAIFPDTEGNKSGPDSKTGQVNWGGGMDSRVDSAEPELMVRMMTPALPVCPDCQMPRHGGYTCDEARALGIILRKAFDEAYERMKEPHLGAAFTTPPPGP